MLKKIIPVLIIAVIVATILFKLNSNKQVAESEIAAETRPVSFAVEATRVSHKKFPLSFSYPGTLEAAETIHVLNEIDGRITEIHFKKGQDVKKGQILAIIRNQTVINNNQISLIAYQKARLDYETLKSLYTAHNASGMEVANALTDLKTKEKQYLISKEQSNQTIICSPVSGTITDKKVNVGDLLPPNAELATVAVLQTVNANVFIAEKDIPSVKAGKKVQITADAYENKFFDGTISSIVPAANDAHVFPVTISIPNEGKANKLLSGMSVTIKFNPADSTSALVLPREAFKGDFKTSYVFLISGDHKAIKTPVNIGDNYETYLQVKSGLNAGDIVITKGQGNITNGMKLPDYKLVNN